MGERKKIAVARVECGVRLGYHAGLPRSSTFAIRRSRTLEICALASGSKGNAVYVGSQGRGVLIDAGLPGREIERRMTAAGIDPRSVEALVVTHEHRDHASGVGVWARRYGVQVHLAEGVDAAIARTVGPRALQKVELRPFAPGEIFEAAGLEFAPVPTSHDACAPVGFRVNNGAASLGFATDLGVVSEPVRRMLSGVQLLYLEANHDEERLIHGPYPAFLKKRIRSAHGHLSNGECADLLDRLVHPGLKAVVLGHLSEVNNEPVLAFQAARQVLARHGGEEDISLLVARQDRPGSRVAAA